MAEVYSAFADFVQQLEDHAQQLVDEGQGLFDVRHQLFGYEGEWPPPTSERLEIFDRSEIEDQFIKQHGDGSLLASDHYSLAGQSDVLAAAEKAFRCRHRSRLANHCHGLGRQSNHASENGFLRQGLMRLPIVEA